jgi:cyclic pyranopterin phosphate synthase
MSGEGVIDRLGRPLGSLRISVTDRCNMRCRYCMPEESYVWLPRGSILSFEEISRLAGVFASIGVDKVRLTGGEPLLRQDLPSLVRTLSRQPGIRDLALTTNGILLEEHARPLKSAGLGRLTVSLDTLRPERMQLFARSNRHPDVVAGITEARAAGFTGTKANSVIIRGYNDDELVDLIEFGKAHAVEMRFIEYMDVGGATGWSEEQVVSRREILARLGDHYGAITPRPVPGSVAPAEQFELSDGTGFGIIASTTEPFCRTCDRGRLTADGRFFLCLYTDNSLDLRAPLRDGATDDDLRELIRGVWGDRRDRGAEARLASPDRTALYQLGTLRSDPHKEMHTRGG